MSNSLRLSEEHGVNPSVAHCVACGAEWGLILFGRLRDDRAAPRDVHDGLCSACEGVVRQGGVMLIEVRDGESRDDPYRTGRVWGITGDGFRRAFPLMEPAPLFYIEASVAREIGLPDPKPEAKS